LKTPQITKQDFYQSKMKKYYILLTFFLIAFNTFAQEKSNKKGFIGFTIGPTIPLGDFADKYLVTNNMAGLAEPGLALNFINFGYKFGKNFSVASSFSNASFSLDRIFGRNGKWRYTNFLVGPMLSFPVHKKFELDFKGTIGIVSAKFQLEENMVNPYVELKSDIGMGFSLGTSLRYHITDRWGLLLNVDYFSSQTKFDSSKRKISSLNPGLGILYRLN
jgi:hypothetical protein